MVQEIRLASGATEADIVKALANLGSGGGTVVLPKGETIEISKGLIVDVAHRDITLDLNGATLQQDGAVTVVLAKGLHTPPEHVSLGTNAQGNTTVSYSKLPADVTVGDWVKVVSDNPIPGDAPTAPTLMGQALQVASISGNVVTFAGALIDQSNYTTNVRAATFESGELVVKNGEVVGDPKLSNSTPPLVQIRETLDAHLDNLSVHDGKGYAISVVDSINASISDVTVKHIANGASGVGVGVQSISSTGTTVKGLYAEDVTHATDAGGLGTQPGWAYISQFGADIGMHVSDSVAYSTRDFAFSWHSESVNGNFDNVLAFDSAGFLQARGIGGSMSDSGGANNLRGVNFFEWGHEDSRNISVDHVTLKETAYYSIGSINNPLNNTVTDSSFESYAQGNNATAAMVAVSNTTLTRAGANPNDVIAGTAGNDLMLGGKGNDTLNGAAGDDYVWGGAGADTLTGGAGHDRFAFHALSEGGDVIADFQGGPSGDVIDLGVMAAKMNWGEGDLVANGYARFVQSGDNVLVQVDQDGHSGKADFVTVATLLDQDVTRLDHSNFHGELWAPEFAADPVQQVQAEVPQPISETAPASAPDPVTVPTAPSTLPDKQVSYNYGHQADSNTLNGDATANKIDGDSGHNQIYGNAGNDRLTGLAGDDLIVGGEGDDQLYGGDGNDMLAGGQGADQLYGGAGSDTATYVTADAAITADLLDNKKNAGGALGDIFNAVENLTGSKFNDVLTGNTTANILDGGKGNDVLNGGGATDTLIGGEGNDWLDGGAYKDVLTGGGGADSFYFASLADAGDTIEDFKPGEDHIVLSASGFGLSPHQDFNFQSAEHVYLYGGNALYAPKNGPTMLYDSSSGRLLWDADGKGEQKAQLVAVLTNAPQISHDDFLIV